MKARSAGWGVFAVVILLAVVMGVVLKRRGADQARYFSPDSLSVPYANAKVFDSWKKFTSSSEWKSAQAKPKPKIVFIGMDGATWNIIDPWIEKGYLPNLARIKKEGSFGLLRSTECFVSPPAWVSMMTGFRPEHTGIYTFGMWDEEKVRFVSNTSEDVAVPYVWDLASLAGRRVGITNMAVTYPVRPVNGILISGLMTPTIIDESRPKIPLVYTPYRPDTADTNVSYSKILQTRFTLFDRNEVVIRVYDSIDDGERHYTYGIVTCTPNSVARAGGPPVKPLRFPIDHYTPWLKIDYGRRSQPREGWCQLQFSEVNLNELHVSAVYCSPDDPEIHYVYPRELAKAIKDKFDYYFPYASFDSLQEPQSAEDGVRWATYFYELEDWDLFTHVFYETDKMQHFSGNSASTLEIHQTIDRFVGWILDQLTDDDYLVIASDHGFDEYHCALDLNKFFSDIRVLEWNADRTINYYNSLAFYNMWAVFYNRQLVTADALIRRGIDVPPFADPMDVLTDYIMENGKGITDLATGKRYPVVFTKVPEDAVGSPPALIVDGTYRDYMVGFWDMKNPHTTITRPLIEDDQRWGHRRNGIFLVYGNGVRQGFEASIKDNMDIGPTILYMMGLPLPANMDGRVMEEVFEGDKLARDPIALVRGYARVAEIAKTPGEQREDLESKLKSLGYIK